MEEASVSAQGAESTLVPASVIADVSSESNLSKTEKWVRKHNITYERAHIEIS